MINIDRTMSDLPISQVMAEILQQLRDHDNLVLQAPPGAGKTTLVPLCLLDQPWLKKSGRIIMLEPRRLAARTAARRMAQMLGQRVGQTVGYRVRLDHKVSDQTRIEVVTEGVLIRKLQQDPELSGIQAVIFDEFHERSQEADLGLALCLDVQQGLRDDLKLIVMSATLDGEKVAHLMGDAPIVTSQGRSHPVEIRYLDRPFTGPVEQAVTMAVRDAIKRDEGNILVFLPGAGEIERCAALIRDLELDVMVAPLYGMMPPADQDRAILPPPAGKRKIVLATAIAETSLTIEGIGIVIDGGLDRSPRYDTRSGMTGLETRRLSRASAEQRAGRAGRISAGICYRLWTAAAQRGLLPFAAPEITKADMMPLALELASWGVGDAGELRWLDLPDRAAMAAAKEVLQDLGALDRGGQISAHGRQMARLAMHPRLAHMVLKAQELGFGQTGVMVAALLAERDILRDKSADMRHRVELLSQFPEGSKAMVRKAGGDLAALQRVSRQVKSWSKSLKLSKAGDILPHKTGLCLALAYPDRIGKRRPGGMARYLLSGGRGAVLDEADGLGCEKYLAVCHLALNSIRGGQTKTGGRDARIYLAAPLDVSDIEEIFRDRIMVREQVEWDGRTSSVLARKRQMLGKMTMGEERLKNPDPAAVLAALCSGIRKMGLGSLPWNRESRDFQARLLFCRRYDADGGWPDLSHEALLDGLEDWLGPYLGEMTTAAQLKSLNLADILKGRLTWQMRERLDQLVPGHYRVPGGSKIALDYSLDPPVLAVRLQEMFGLDRTPTVMAGRVRLLVHLLSPAGRPLQVTQDLENFWHSSYDAVKKDMKGRYPKHHWPDDPLAATPTRHVKGNRQKK